MTMSNTHAEQRARDSILFDPLPASRWVRVGAEGIIVAVPYSESLSKLLRSLPGALWDPDCRHWRYPCLSCEAIRNAFARIESLAGAATESAGHETLRQTKDAERQVLARPPQVLGHPRTLRPEFLDVNVGAPDYDLALEAIGDDKRQFGIPARAWVAQITGVDGRGRLVRSFLAFRADYAQANSVGSRGIMRHYSLSHGPIYDVSRPVSHRYTDRYYVCIKDRRQHRLSHDDVMTCL